jgi:hypothetical protein
MEMPSFHLFTWRRGRAPSSVRLQSLIMACAITVAVALVSTAHAATPGSGTISLGNPSVTWTGSITGAGSGENTCVDGVSCDSFQVILDPGDYTGKQINVTINWTIPAYDYDLYVHVGSLRGPELPSSAGPPPATSEQVHIGIDPPIVTTPRVWWAHPQAATVPPGQTYNGTAALASMPPSPTVTYLASDFHFSHNVPLYARGTVRTEEPSVRVDVRGNCYVSGIRGVPAGVDLWRFDLDPKSAGFDPEMRNGIYLGQPDVFQQMGAEDSTAGGADGGGDIDIATSFPTDPGATPVVTMASLAAANVSSSVSTDKGQTFQHSSAVADIPSDDRQWIEADGPDKVYLFYRAPVPSNGLFLQTSTDHGATYGSANPILDSNNPITTSPGYIDVDHSDGTIYVSHQNSNAMYVSHSTDGGSTWTTRLVDGLTAHGHLFDPVKVGDDGTVYTVWSNDRHIYYSYSQDHGDSWSTPAVVENPDLSLTNVFPWLEAGSDGRLDVVWFGTQSENIGAAEWDVYFAQSLDANTATPTFRQQIVSDHRIHGSNISEGGLTGAANRNLGDYFQVAYDPQGAAVISFSDDHNDFDGNTYVTRQLDGTGMLADANGDGTVSPVTPTELSLYQLSLPQVTDPVHDALLQLQPIPTDNPFDIVSIRYYADNDGPNGPYINAVMTLSGLTAAADGNWRIAFTANAPGSDDQRPNRVSDHGDMFYLLASDSSGLASFTYGTAYRDSNPLVPVVFTAYAMAYNAPVGFADSGSIDTTTRTVRVKIAISKINALIPNDHAPIAEGSWLGGLRGAASAVGRGPRDDTRGGRFDFLVDYLGLTGVTTPKNHGVFAVAAAPNPAPGASTITYALPTRERGTLGIYDVAGRLVSTLASGTLDPGLHRVRWDGRTTSGAAAPGGIYFVKLSSAGREVVSRLALLR